MKKHLLYIVPLLAILLAYFLGFSLFPGLSTDYEVETQNTPEVLTAKSKQDLESIPDYIPPEKVKSQLTPEQQKRLSKLNEAQQEEALSAMGHQKSLSDVVSYAEKELDRLEQEDAELQALDARADQIIQKLNAEVDNQNESLGTAKPQSN